MIAKVEPKSGTQDVYLDAPPGSLEAVEHSTPGGLDAELDAVAGDGAQAGAPAVQDSSVSDFEELPESEELLRAHDRKPDSMDVETALMLYEKNCAMRKGQHWQNEERWGPKYEPERIGRILHMYDFVKRLAGVGVELKLNQYGRLGRVGVNALACPGCSAGPLAPCAESCTGRGFDYREHEIGKKAGFRFKVTRAELVTMHRLVDGGTPKKEVASCFGFTIGQLNHILGSRPEDASVWPGKKLGKTGRGKKIFLAVRGERVYDWMTLATLHNGASPEYSVMRFDRFGVPTNEKYHGWRTALLGLMEHGVVSKAQAELAFGKVIRVSEATEFYLQQLKAVPW